jgi:hypothetical protein
MALPRVVFDIGFTASATAGVFTVGDPVLGRVGLNPVGADDIWTTLPDRCVQSWSIRRGATRGDDPTLRYDPGTLTLVLNDGDRRFDPENLLGPYVAGGVSQVLPEVRVRARAVWDGVTYPLFRGTADDFKPSYNGGFWTLSNVVATDASKVFAAQDRQAVTAVGAGENSGARVSRVLDQTGWPSADRVIATGDTTLQATTLQGNQLTELQLVQDTEQGELYVDGQGRVVFRNRRAMLTDTRSNTSQAVFGDGGFASTGEIPYASADMSTPTDALVNVINVARAGGTEQLVEDVVSKARYLPKSHTRDDLLMETDDAAFQWAAWLRYQYATPARRFSRIDFNTPRPDVEATFWPALLGRDLGDRITVKLRPAGGGDPIVKDCFVRGFEHDSANAAVWTSALILQDASRYTFFRVGDPILGRVGLNAVAY